MKLNKDQQWKMVIDALAVALVALDESKLIGQRPTIELSFVGAWRDWSGRHNYPSVDPNDFYIYAMKSARRVGTHGAFDWRKSLNASLVGGTSWWNPEDLLEFVAEHSPTPVALWKELARSFVAEASQRSSPKS